MARDGVAAKIYITGAACAGVTTLGARLADTLAAPHVDCDDFYWLPTDPPYTCKRPVADRLTMIKRALGPGGWVFSGSLDGWGDPLIEDADVIVFLSTRTAIRLSRLKRREKARFGERILPGGDMHGIHRSFVDWAAQYDEPHFFGRSRARHESWLETQTVPVLRLDGEQSPDALRDRVLAAIGAMATA